MKICFAFLTLVALAHADTTMSSAKLPVAKAAALVDSTMMRYEHPHLEDAPTEVHGLGDSITSPGSQASHHGAGKPWNPGDAIAYGITLGSGTASGSTFSIRLTGAKGNTGWRQLKYWSSPQSPAKSIAAPFHPGSSPKCSDPWQCGTGQIAYGSKLVPAQRAMIEPSKDVGKLTKVEVKQDHKGAPWVAVGLKVNTSPNRRIVGLGNGVYYVNTQRPEVKVGQNLVTGETAGVTLSHCEAEYCEERELALFSSMDQVEQNTLHEDEKAVDAEIKIKQAGAGTGGGKKALQHMPVPAEEGDESQLVY